MKEAIGLRECALTDLDIANYFKVDEDTVRSFFLQRRMGAIAQEDTPHISEEIPRDQPQAGVGVAPRVWCFAISIRITS